MRQDPAIGNFAHQLEDLKATIAKGWHPESPESGFVEWLIDRTSTSLDSSWEAFDPGTVPGYRWSEAPILAAAGFRMASVGRFAEHLRAWLDGMQRLAARDPIPVDRNSFLFRPLELLGLVIGSLAVAQQDSTPFDWLRDIVRENIKHLAVTNFWNRGLTLMTVDRLGLSDALTLEPRRPQDPIDAASAVSFSMIDQGASNRLSTLAGEVLEKEFLSRAALTKPDVSGVAQAAVYAIALQVSVVHAVGALSVGPNTAADLVCDLARHFPVFVAELTKRHGSRPPLKVKDEYDVQDLFRAVLRLHFRDVRKEEWNPSYGGVQSRSDFLLKPERIVVETKMTRQGLGQREVVEELTIDKAHYRGHPNCRTLVCFVYDPDRRLANPGAVELDLADKAELLDVRVVVRPDGF